MKKKGADPGFSTLPEEYLNDIKNRVTRQFCTFYFGLSVLAVPAAFMAHGGVTLGINLSGLFMYAVPFLLVQFTTRYRLAAQCIVGTAMLVVVMNGIFTDCDLSPSTTVWYFVYLVFAHLVLNLAWALVVAGIGIGTVAVFSIAHIRDLMHYSNSYLIERPILIGSPIAFAVSCIALIYLLTVYKKIRDVMIHNVLFASQEANRILGVLSHDMRNYLGAINSIQELVTEEYPQEYYPDLVHNLQMVGEAALRGIALVEEVVTASRDLTEQKIFLEKTELAQFMRPLLDRYRIIARVKGISLSGERSLDGKYARLNREKFSRVIENLLSNAVKFSRDGDTISVGAERDKAWLTIIIKDTGIGIPKELQKNIFEPFSGAGRMGTASEKTVGLGMSIVKKLVDLHSGQIRLESQVNKGTSVFIRIAAA